MPPKAAKANIKWNCFATDSAFTLLEVIIATMILSSALVILLGMQSSAIDQTIRDRQELDSMLLARRLLASIEVDASGPNAVDRVPVGEKDMSGIQALLEHSILEDSGQLSDEERLRLNSYRVYRNITFWGIPNIDDQAMKRIELRVWPLATPDNVLEVVFYVPNPISPTTP